MKRLLLLWAYFTCQVLCLAQTIVNPTFERCDVPEFYITKVEITKDTTYVYCSCYAEAGSWATISPKTYLRDSKSNKKFPLQRCEGLPYSPKTKSFSQAESYEVLFCFPSIAGIQQFDFIESDDEKGFNIYNVDLTHSYKMSFSDMELKRISEMVSSYDSSIYTEKAVLLKDDAISLYNLASYNVSKGNYNEAIRLGSVEIEIREKVFGKEHPSYIESLRDLTRYYSTIGNYTKTIQLLTELISVLKITIGSENKEYATSLSELALYHAYIGNYSEAVKFEKEALEIKKKLFGTENFDYAQSANNLAGFYADIGNYTEAIILGKEAVNIKRKVLGTEHPEYALSLRNLALYFSVSGNYLEAIRLGTEAMEIRKRVLGTEHPDYAISLDDLAEYYSKIGKYAEAIKLETEVMKIRKEVYGTDHLLYSTALNCLAQYFSNYGNNAEAIRLGTEAMEICKNNFGTEHPDYASSLHNLASYNSDIGNYAEAARLETDAMKIRKKILGTDHSDYVMSLSDLASYNSRLGNYDEAIKQGTKAMEIRKRILGTEHPDFATSLNNLAVSNSDIGNYTEAIRLGTEAMEIRKRILGTEHPDYAKSLSSLATYNSSLGNYAEAISFETKAIEILKRVLGTANPSYATSLSNLATFYSYVGNYAEAIRLGTEAMEIRKKVLGTEHPDYATSLNNLATYNSSLGNYTDAIKLGTKAMEIRKRVFGTEHLNYAHSLVNLGAFNYDIGNYAEDIRLETEAIDIFKRVLGQKHPDYAMSLNNLAASNSLLGNYSEAIRLETEALEIYKERLGTEHPNYATTLSSLATLNSYIGNFSDAINLETEAKEVIKRVLGIGHPLYVRSLSNLVSDYFISGNYEKAYYYMAKQMEYSRNYILNNLGGLSSNYQKSLWTTQFANEYLNILPYLVSQYTNKESISELFNKTCLFAKGILLNTGIEMRKLILESKDSSLIAKYHALSTNINIYSKLVEKPIKERFVNADSLNKVIQKQEMELACESKAYGDYTRNLTITWKDVQRNLQEGDVAVEFLDYPLIGTNSTMYVALTLKKSYDAPHMVTLFEKNQLKEISEDDYYTKTDVYNLVWKPLEEELNGVKNIYFTPSGELHRIGIEFLPISKTENICDVYTFHRLSSTRQIAGIQDETEGKNSILYGGLDYDEKSNTITIDSVSAKGSVLRSAICRANVNSLLLRSSFDYLEGTKKEADMIAADMKLHRVPYVYYNGTDGTEESFKQLDGTRPKLMHIATHGFFLTEEEAKKSWLTSPKMLLMAENPLKASRPVEDKPMTRSGLLLSGCNHAIQHEQIPESEEDGILTAQEISTLDLRGLDLVVLSACQTGLGDVVSGEGVFGLQRGFKKAGAKTILMSLGKVDDEATRILMVEFYRNLMNGMTKRQSLKDAQQYLRKVDNGKYDAPKYWASFIMLDGLN